MFEQFASYSARYRVSTKLVCICLLVSIVCSADPILGASDRSRSGRLAFHVVGSVRNFVLPRSLSGMRYETPPGCRRRTSDIGLNALTVGINSLVMLRWDRRWLRLSEMYQTVNDAVHLSTDHMNIADPILNMSSALLIAMVVRAAIATSGLAFSLIQSSSPSKRNTLEPLFDVVRSRNGVLGNIRRTVFILLPPTVALRFALLPDQIGQISPDVWVLFALSWLVGGAANSIPRDSTP